jgi:anti-anti-sigma factor
MPAETTLEIQVQDEPDRVRLVLIGELDIGSVKLLETKIAEVASGNGNAIVIDLDRVGFMDSTGLRAVLEADVRSREDGRALRFTRGSRQVERLFKLAGVDTRLSFED